MRSGSVLLVLMSVSLVGCADKSPEGVCKKMESLGKAAGKKGNLPPMPLPGLLRLISI